MGVGETTPSKHPKKSKFERHLVPSKERIKLASHLLQITSV
jgi:hypothetical protein